MVVGGIVGAIYPGGPVRWSKILAGMATIIVIEDVEVIVELPSTGLHKLWHVLIS